VTEDRGRHSMGMCPTDIHEGGSFLRARAGVWCPRGTGEGSAPLAITPCFFREIKTQKLFK
jgi:hypothetical protein